MKNTQTASTLLARLMSALDISFNWLFGTSPDTFKTTVNMELAESPVFLVWAAKRRLNETDQIHPARA